MLTKFLLGKTEGERTLGRSRRRRESYVKMCLKGICGKLSIELTSDRDRWRNLVNI